MTKCPGCGSEQCYNSGFTIECPVRSCRFFSEKQLAAATEQLKQDHGECAVPARKPTVAELDAILNAEPAAHKLAPAVPSRRGHYQIMSKGPLSDELFFGVGIDDLGTEVWRGCYRKSLAEAKADIIQHKLASRWKPGALEQISPLPDPEPAEYTGTKKSLQEAYDNGPKISIGTQARLPSKPHWGVGTVEAFDGDGTGGDYEGDVGIDFGEDFKGLVWRKPGEIEIESAEDFKERVLERLRNPVTRVGPELDGYGVDLWKYLHPRFPRIFAPRADIADAHLGDMRLDATGSLFILTEMDQGLFPRGWTRVVAPNQARTKLDSDYVVLLT